VAGEAVKRTERVWTDYRLELDEADKLLGELLAACAEARKPPHPGEGMRRVITLSTDDQGVRVHPGSQMVWPEDDQQ
jgi:hypothetical protein